MLIYFTIQSNLLVALISLVGGCFLLRNKPVGSAWLTVKLAGAVSITLTCVVFAVLLAPLLGPAAWSLPNTLTHLVVPLAAVVDFFTVASGADIRRKNVVYVVIPPFLYAVYAGVGYLRGWDFAGGQRYPYFFLNWGSPAGAFGFTDGLPYMGSAWWILAIMLFLVAVGLGYLALAAKIGKSRRRQA